MKRILAISHGFLFLIVVSGLAAAGTSGTLLGTPSNTGPTNTRGIGGAMPAYYDGKLFTINFAELSPTAEATVLARNGQFNNIYQYGPGLPGGAPFVSVIDAITADGPGFNPLWREVQLVFSANVRPRQFGSDDEIVAAVASGEISLAPTTEVYRCSVIGRPPAAAPTASTAGVAPSAMTTASSLDPATTNSTWGQVKAQYAR